MGCVLPAGRARRPRARPRSARACRCRRLHHDQQDVRLGHEGGDDRPRPPALGIGARLIVAGGMESMTNAPYLLDQARGGYRMGHGRTLDHMFLDGLEDAYDKGRLMGTFAEDCAQSYQFTREAQDAYAARFARAGQRAIADGAFAWEIAPVTVKAGKERSRGRHDEQPLKARPDKIPTLKPAFRDGRHGDGGEFELDLGRRGGAGDDARGRGRKARSRAACDSRGPCDPRRRAEDFPTAPIGALRKLFDRTGWSREAVDLYEINEAFAVVAMAAMRDLALPHEKVNVNGGACALGHPIGASGARIIVTLIGALRARGLKRGVATLCIGGGEATAMAIEAA